MLNLQATLGEWVSKKTAAVIVVLNDFVTWQLMCVHFPAGWVREALVGSADWKECSVLDTRKWIEKTELFSKAVVEIWGTWLVKVIVNSLLLLRLFEYVLVLTYLGHRHFFVLSD